MNTDKMKLAVPLATQAITLAVGVLTLFGITIDPEAVEAFKAQVTDLGAQLIGLALIGSALTASAQDITKKMRNKGE